MSILGLQIATQKRLDDEEEFNAVVEWMSLSPIWTVIHSIVVDFTNNNFMHFIFDYFQIIVRVERHFPAPVSNQPMTNLLIY
jgi:hypothetical protein